MSSFRAVIGAIGDAASAASTLFRGVNHYANAFAKTGEWCEKHADSWVKDVDHDIEMASLERAAARRERRRRLGLEQPALTTDLPKIEVQ
ncbi:hypothetical protein [Xenophilus sp. Marseille-Q4582]|uniref:hypothetical protein n=1 Tax=Xenophilus sp. Marseille-Q4582 TaxID=2866600 RepID=UPI001CE460C5|nr:hypothetical protein [Xenophilus sp. Marseille-Q4582]